MGNNYLHHWFPIFWVETLYSQAMPSNDARSQVTFVSEQFNLIVFIWIALIALGRHNFQCFYEAETFIFLIILQTQIYLDLHVEPLLSSQTFSSNSKVYKALQHR